jgi:hypothetical protein
MIRQGNRGASAVADTTLYRRAGGCAVVAGVLSLIWLPSTAAAAPTSPDPRTRSVTDHNNDGNGHHNVSAASVRSPVRNRGYQHTTNRNPGGVSDAQNALCHNVRVCNVRQHVTFTGPRPATPPAPPAPSPSPDTSPAPQPPAAVRGPLLYLTPRGLMFIGGGGSAPATGGTPGQGWLDCPPDLLS